MTEHDSGEGRLVSLAADQSTYIVDYDLKVDTDVTGSSEKFDPVKVVKHYTLQIKPRNNDKIADGEYVLKTSDETLRVRQSGQQWKVVR